MKWDVVRELESITSANYVAWSPSTSEVRSQERKHEDDLRTSAISGMTRFARQISLQTGASERLETKLVKARSDAERERERELSRAKDDVERAKEKYREKGTA